MILKCIFLLYALVGFMLMCRAPVLALRMAQWKRAVQFVTCLFIAFAWPIFVVRIYWRSRHKLRGSK